MSDREINLEGDMRCSQDMINALADKVTSATIYDVLCHEIWYKLRTISKPEDEQIVEVLTADFNDHSRTWSCSARYAGEVISSIRNDFHGENESYCNWYNWTSMCVEMANIKDHTAIYKMFRDIGWVPKP